MRLHRLVLTNYRGISHREIEFPDRGVTIVSGPNEVGKTSMIEALDLLLESKDRSSKKDVKQVKPTHSDVGAEVTAEISTGPYRFVYHKRFHKQCATDLTILAPRREQLSGDEAHERVRAMLAETVDTGLWQAQRVLQATSTSAVDLSGCDALSRALDIAAGDSADLAGLSGTEPVLIEKIDAEYGRYFTPTGRPTGEWATAIAALSDADADVAECAAAAAEVDDRVSRHAELSAELAEISGDGAELGDRLTAAEQAAAAVAALDEQLKAGESAAAAAEATSTAAAAAQRERQRLCVEVDDRVAAITAAEIAAAAALEAAVLGREVRAAAEEATTAAVTASDEATARLAVARCAVAELAERDEARLLTARLGRIDTTQQELEATATELAGIALTTQGFRDIEVLAAEVAVAQTQVDLSAPSVAFTAASDVELIVDGQRIAVGAGQTHELNVLESTGIEVPGIGVLTIAPGATGVDTHEKLAAALHRLAAALAGAGVEDIDTARVLHQSRTELQLRRDQLTATLSGLLGDDDVSDLRGRLDALRTGRPDADAAVDPVAVRAELAAAEQTHTAAVAAHRTQRTLLDAAAARCVEKDTQATLLQDRVAAAVSECAAVRGRLAAQRADIGDDVLAERTQSAAEIAAGARGIVEELAARLAEADPDAVAAELAGADTALAAWRQRNDELVQALRDLRVELELMGTEGRAGKLDSARIAHEHAAAEHHRVQGRANAARLLRDVMARHRDSTRLRYVEPFRAELERLGRTVFGPSFEAEIDSDLQICNRTLDGRTVPFDSLSGGAKEQLGILSRLAVAALVDAEDSVPVMIDDALGFTDADRLARMAAVFDTVGEQGQVIVLTCVADRYRGVQGAHSVELS